MELCGKTFSCFSYFFFFTIRELILRTHCTHVVTMEKHCFFLHGCRIIRNKVTQTGEKPYESPEYEKSFRQNIHLSMCQRTHVSGSPSEYNEVGKSYSQINLFMHYGIHNWTKPYMYKYCGK